jgi:hypothetical protein
MIRTTCAATVASLAFAVLASAAHAAPIGGANVNYVKAPSPLVSVGGHQVCLKAQCPGRSRIVCGCKKPVR